MSKKSFEADRCLSFIKTGWLFILSWIVLIHLIIRNLFTYFYSIDIYHMLSAGKAISQFGVLTDDVFFIDSGHKIVIQQWLYDFIVYKTYNYGGKIAVLLFTLLLAMIFALLAVKLLRLFNVDIRLTITAVLSVLLYDREVISIRPGLLTMVLLLTQVLLCEIYLNNKRTFWLLFIPVLTFIEINAHATMWVMHFIFLLPYLVPVPEYFCKKLSIVDHHISLFNLSYSIIGMIISLFINPYGLKGITILFDQSEIVSLGIKDMNPLSFSSKFVYVFIIMLLVTAFLLGKVSIHSSNAFMFFGTAIMMMKNIRNVQMFSIGIILIACDLLLIIPISKVDIILTNTKKTIIVLSSILVVACIAVSTVDFPYASKLHDEPQDSIYTPVDAVAYLNEDASSDSRIFTDFNSGSFISWSGYKIYFSNRTEGYCQAVNGGFDLVNEYLSVYNNTENDYYDTYDEFLNKYSFDYLIVDTRNRMYTYLLTSESYHPVVDGNGYVLFEAA